MRSAKALILSIVLGIFVQQAQSQVWNWARRLGNLDNSGLNGMATVIDIQGNHVVLSGIDTMYTYDGFYSLNNRFSVSKFDHQGTLLWTRNFSAPTRTMAFDLVTDSAGSIYLLTEKFTQVDGSAYTGPNAPNYFTKLTAMGDIRWVKPLGTMNIYNKKMLKSDGSGIYLYAGASQTNNFQFLDTAFTAPNPPSGSPEFVFLAKVDTTGTRKWQRLFIDTSGYSWPLAMDINNKNQVVFSGIFRRKIWLSSSLSITNGPGGPPDYQYYAVLNTQNGQLLGYESIGIDVSGLHIYPAISIDDSSFITYPQQVNSMTRTVQLPTGGTAILTYPQGHYLIARRMGIPGGPIVAVKQISGFRLNNIYDLESDPAGNLFASLKLYFTTGTGLDSSFHAVTKYKIDSDTGRLSLWQANVGGTYYAGGGFSNMVSLSPSLDVRGSDISFTGGFRGTGNFGPHQVAANNFRKSFIAALKDGACIISGKAYIDNNNNGSYDNGEIPVRARQISTQNNYTAFTDMNGNYQLFTDTGNYTVQLQASLPYYNIVPVSHAVAFSTYGQTAADKNFAFQAALTVNDLEVDLTPLNIARAGRPLHYMVTLRNTGTTTLTNKYSLKMGGSLSFVSSDSAATVTVDSVVWNYTNFRPYETRTNLVTCNVSTAATVNSIIKSTGYVFPAAGDSTPVNNVDTAFSIVRASYDPNDKITFPVTSVHIDSAQQGKQFLEYMIRFQNTGNDTAFQVRLVDSLTSKLNIQTFELISSSHPVLLSRRGLRTMEFYFPNILLPDSTTNEARSHGFVKFRAKPVSSVILTDSVYNFADIFFDYNSAVRTNTIATGFRTTIVTGINDPQRNTSDLRIYPNPATSFIVYRLEKSPREVLAARIYDISGRVYYSKDLRGNGGTLTGEIPIGGLPAGGYFLEISSSKTRYVREFLARGK